MYSDQSKDKFRLSQPQQRIWNIEKIYTGTPVYNIGGVSVFDKGGINLSILRQSFIMAIKKNRSLSLRLKEIDGEPWQYFDDDPRAFAADEFDFSDSTEPYNDFCNWAKDVFEKPFTLTDSALFYIAVIKISDIQSAFLLKFHHLIMDGWSVAIIINDAFENYRGIKAGQIPEYEVGNTYKDFIDEEAQYIASREFSKDREFWNNKFLDFEYTSLRRIPRNITGARKDFVFENSLSELLLNYINSNSITWNIFFIALALFWEQRNSGKSDLVIGVPTLNRNGKKHKKTTGMYTSTMPLRVEMQEFITVKKLFDLVRQELKAGYQHQKYPYNYLVKDLELRKKGIDRLFGTCVNYYATNLPASFEDAGIANLEFYSGCQLFDLQISIKEWGVNQGLQLQFDYNTEVYGEIEIDFIFESLKNLATAFCSNDQEVLKNIEILSPSQKAGIGLYFNKQIEYPGTELLFHYWKQHLAEGDKPFIIDEKGEIISHHEFYLKAIRLASYLKKFDIRKRSRVCIIMTHSAGYINAVLSVLLLGAAFIPVDPQTPSERVRYIIEDTNATLVITDVVFFTNIEQDLDVKVLFFGDIAPDESIKEYEPPQIYNSDLAYLIYTSGTTGTPKGVAINHGNLINYCKWAAGTYCTSRDDVFAFFTSIGFDLTITSVFVPLLNGSCIKIFSQTADNTGHVVYDVFASKDVNIIKATPSHLKLLKHSTGVSVNKNMKLIVGGEDLSTDLARHITSLYDGNVDIYNEYGPTEATVGCMIHRFDPGQDFGLSVPIGKPVENTLIYLLDDKLRQVPMGSSGQIYIGGNSVSEGYWNKTKLNGEKFIKNLFGHPTSFYKTGDLARFSSSYNLVYEGRIDDQVKINGNRVEIKEIEAVLKSHEFVKDAFVLPYSGQKHNHVHTSDKTILLAYLITDSLFSEDALKDYMVEKLPAYMIPASFFVLNSFPLNKNGKIDQNSLPLPEAFPVKNDSASFSSGTDNILVPVIRELLSLGSVDEQDNFFSIGGDSISAIQLSSRLKSMNLSLAVQDILSNPVISSMAKKVNAFSQDKTDGKTNDIHSIWETHQRFSPPSVAWFFNQNFKVPEHYNQSVLLEVKVNINRNVLAEIIKALIHAHPALCINAWPGLKQVGYEETLLYKKISISEFELNELESTEKQIAAIGQSLKASIRFDGDFLFKAAIIKGTGGSAWVLLTFHHLIIDGVSWQILFNDLEELFRSVKERRILKPGKENCRWDIWAKHFMEKYSYPITQAENEIIDHIAGIMAGHNNNESRLPAGTHADTSTIEFYIDIKGFQPNLQKAVEVYRVSTHELLLIIFMLSWHEVGGNNEIFLEVEKHGRTDWGEELYDIDRTVGWFTVFELYSACIYSGDMQESIVLLKDQLRKPLFNPFRYSILKDITEQFTGIQQLVRFNYLGNFSAADNPFFSVAEIGTGPDVHPANQPTSRLEFNCWIRNNRLYVRLNYNSLLVDEKVVNEFMTVFQGLFRNIVCENSNYSTGGYVTYSDFDESGLQKEDFDNLFS